MNMLARIVAHRAKMERKREERRPDLTRDAADVLERREPAALRPVPRTWNREHGTFDAVVASAVPVERQGFDEVLSIEPGSVKLPASLPVLDTHNRQSLDARLGTVENLRIEGAQLIGTVRLSKHNDRAKRIAAEIEDGHLPSLSIGYRVGKWSERQNNGRRERVAVQWEPLEASLVACPADPNATMREDNSMNMRTTPAPGTRAATNAELRTIAATAGLTREQADGWIDRELTPDAARAEAFEALRARGATVATITTATHTCEHDDLAQRRDAMSEGLHLRFGAPGYQPRNPRAREFAGYTIRDVAADCLRIAGVSTTGLSPATIIQRAGAHSTSDFPIILQNTLGLSLREAYTSATTPLRQLGRQRNAADFRRMERLWLSAGGFKLLPKNEGGEYHEGTLIEGKEGWKIRNYGRIFSITDEALINDQLGAFTDLSRTLGTAAATLEADVIVDLVKENPTLEDGFDLFSVEHGNVPLTGSAIDADSLDAARVSMRRQRGPGGEILNLQPRWLVVAPEQETNARMATTAVQATEVANANPFADLMVIVDARLDAGEWYVVAGDYDGLEYGSLEGENGPDIRTEVEFDTDNLRTRVRHRFGAGFIDHRAWYRNTGAAG